jgi:hypothetical protein
MSSEIETPGKRRVKMMAIFWSWSRY